MCRFIRLTKLLINTRHIVHIEKNNELIPIREYLLKDPKYKDLFHEDNTPQRFAELNKQISEEQKELVKTHSIYAITTVKEDGSLEMINPLTKEKVDSIIADYRAQASNN